MTPIPWDAQNDAQRARTLAAAKRLGTRHAHAAWPLLLREARSRGWPKAFEADLYIHDRAALASMKPDTRFVWAVGEAGTQLTWLDRGSFTEREAREHVRYLEEYRPAMFYWDGSTLRACTRFDAFNVMTGRAWNDIDGWGSLD